VFLYFFAAWELPCLSLRNQNRSRSRLRQFSTCRWARGASRLHSGAHRGYIAPGARSKFGAPPCSKLEVFLELMHWIKYSWHYLDFSAPPQWFGPQGVVPFFHPTFTRLHWFARNWSVFSQVYFFKTPDDSLERKGSSESRNAIWKTDNWLKMLQASNMKTKKQLQGCCHCSSWILSLSAS